jgi:membrane-associated phospholipid phosphatase
VTRAAAIALVVALAGSARAETEHRKARLAIIGGATAVYITSVVLLQDRLAPAECRWCSANALDTVARDAFVWSDRGAAATASTVTGYFLAPASALGLLALADSSQFVDDAIPVLEAALAAQIVTQLVKLAFARQRPYAHFGTGPATPSSEDNLSFTSGHTNIAFAFAVGAGTVAHRRGTRYEPVIWASGLTLATATAYLRIAADKHYLTDTLGGAVIGAAAGLFVPRLTGSLPEMQVVPGRSVITLAGRF